MVAQFYNVTLEWNIGSENFFFSFYGEVSCKECRTARALDSKSNTLGICFSTDKRIGVENSYFPKGRFFARKCEIFFVYQSAMKISYGYSFFGCRRENVLPFRFRFDTGTFMSPNFSNREHFKKSRSTSEMIGVWMCNNQSFEFENSLITEERNYFIVCKIAFAFVHSRINEKIMAVWTFY